MRSFGAGSCGKRAHLVNGGIGSASPFLGAEKRQAASGCGSQVKGWDGGPMLSKTQKTKFRRSQTAVTPTPSPAGEHGWSANRAAKIQRASSDGSAAAADTAVKASF